MNKKLEKLAKNYKKEILLAFKNAIKGKIRDSNRFIFLGDFVDYLEICNLCLKHKYQDAYCLLDSLDTAARDEFPNKLYDELEKYNELL